MFGLTISQLIARLFMHMFILLFGNRPPQFVFTSQYAIIIFLFFALS